MSTFWERAAHSVNRTIRLLVNLVISHFGFEGRSSVLILPAFLVIAYVLLFVVLCVACFGVSFYTAFTFYASS